MKPSKKRLNKNLRTALIIICIVLIAVVSILINTQGINAGTKQEKIAVYQYEESSNASYQVGLKPNDVYQGDVIGEGSHLITAFIEKVFASFEYNFKGNERADISGTYSITAMVEGFTGEGEEYKSLWKKEFPISPVKTFKTNDGVISITEDVSISLDEYNEFVRDFIEESNVESQAKLDLVMNVELDATTTKGSVREERFPTISIPLNVNSFEISKTGVGDDVGVIEEVHNTPIEPNKIGIILYVSLLILLASGLVYLIWFTSGVEPDYYEVYVKKLFKEHGSRLVALNTTVSGGDDVLEVHSMDDLIKVADEISKPIFYQYNPNLKEIAVFYLYDDLCTYIFDVQKAFVKKVEVKKLNEPRKKVAEQNN